MEWTDDSCESFLRQFQPSHPRPLTTNPSARIRWAAGIAIAATVVIAASYELIMRRSASAPALIVSPTLGTAVGTDRKLPATSLTPAPGRPANELQRSVGPSGGVLSLNPASRPDVRANEEASAPARGTVTHGATERYKVGGAIKPPVKVVDVKPIYPEAAQAARIEGLVILGIVIGEDGGVIDTQVVRSIPELDQAAIDAVRQWRYEPTYLNGEPIELEMNVTINFSLR